MKILIVDDIKENLQMLESLLRGYGYEVESAADGVEALDKASHEDFDMIISDILMPRMDGFQLCREVKKNRKLKDIAFVFYTATYTDTRDEEFALSLGAERFIIKPTEPDDFIEILQEIIKSYRMGTLKAPKLPIEDETVYLKEYNERLVRKLEDKMLDLEKVNTGLRESEEKYRDLIDNANDAVIVFERTGYISFVNPKFCEMTGYSIDEAKKLHFNKLIHPDDLDMCTEYFQKRQAGGKVPRNYEVRLLTRAGKTIYIDNNASTIEKEGRIIGILAIMRDITKRKRAQEALQRSEKQLRALASRLQEVEEVERKRLARELHDQVGQNLTALNINLTIIRSELSPESLEKIAARLNDSISLVVETTERIRNVMAELRPELLDDYGLVAVLRWYCEHFGKRTGVMTIMHGDDISLRMPESVELALFRIAQEALTNVAKHAKASQVSLTFEKTDKLFRLTIDDNGKGFDSSALSKLKKQHGWGLLTMQERAQALDGQVRIESEPGKGTRVIIEVKI